MEHFISKFPNEEIFLAWLRTRLMDGLLADMIVDGYLFKKTTVTTDSTAGNLTYTAAMLLGGIILRDPQGNRNDVTPTAALLAAAIPNVKAGTSFIFTIRNTAGAAETITVTAGVGCTLSGTMTIAQNNSKSFLVVFTSTTAYTVYSLGTVVH